MTQKGKGPRSVGGCGGPGKLEEAGQVSSPQKIAQNQPEGPDWREVAARRFPQAVVLWPIDEGPYAVVSTCGQRIVSLHATLDRAREVKADLDRVGCCKPYPASCQGRHEIIDLRKPARRGKP
jgi:hypothetical protein